MSLIRTFLAGKAKQIKHEQHWQTEVNMIVRPEEIKLRGAERLNAVKAALAADDSLMATFKTLKLTNPPE